ncbi:MAG: zf-HC2 domain-containing protein [Nocardioidaceae bacterium]
MEPFDPGTPFEDPALDDFERAATARAFASLPERWQLVLWHTEVEGDKPADIAPLLGMTANSVAALAYRAREGLRQAYLRSHLADTADDSCRWVTERLGGFVRGGLSRRDHARVEEHLEDCRKCTVVYLELVEVNANLRVLLAPLLLGSAAAGYLTAAGHTGLAAAPWWLRGRQVLRGHQGAAAAAVAAVAVTAIAATAVIGTRNGGSESELSGGPDASSELNGDGPFDSSVDPTDRPDRDGRDRPSERDARDDDRQRDRDRDRNVRESTDETDDVDSPTVTDNDPDEPGETEPTDETSTEPTETTDSTEPTDDPSTQPTDPTDPTETTEPTDDPSRLADLKVGPRIDKSDFLGLLWNELTVPAKGVQKVETASMAITVENMVAWSQDSSSDETADWSCGQVGSETILCTLSDVEKASDPQDLGLSLFTSGTRSKITADISASDYRDPKPGNNSVSTHVVL